MKPIISRTGTPVHAIGRDLEVHEWSHGPMDGPPIHVHHADDEAWHVLEGTLRFTFADGWTDVEAGGSVLVPAGVAHTFGSTGDVRYLIIGPHRIFALIAALHAEHEDDEADIYRQFDSEIVV